MLKTINTNSDLLSLLKNKKVVIVGPSPHLIGKKVGHLIDKYDLVCRINEVLPIGYEEDYGSRTDIVVHNCGTQFIDMFRERLIESSDVSKKLKYVICPSVKGVAGDANWQTWPDDYQSAVVENFKKINIFDIPFYWIGMFNYRQIYSCFGSEPNGGQIAIFLLLFHEVEELLITGFSFYAQGNYPSQSHRPGHVHSDRVDIQIGEPSHPQNPQKKVFKEIILKDFRNIIKIDSYLNDLLECHHERVLKL